MNPQMKPTERKYANVLRPLTSDERNGLRTWLQRDGLRNALVLDQHGDLLDGYHREELCAELGITVHYRSVTTNDPVNWIKSNQKARRNLNREEMRMLIEEQIIATPHLSNVAVAKIVGASDPTVGKVRNELVAKGKVGNVVRFDAVGRVSKDKPRHSKVSNVDRSKPQNPMKAQLTALKEQKMAEAQQRFFGALKDPKPTEKAPAMTDADRLSKYGPPPVLDLKNDKLRNLPEAVIYHFADSGDYHSIPKMIAKLDPEGRLKLSDMHFSRLAYDLKNRRKDIFIETRPGVGQSKHYRFYRQDKTVGLSVLKAKFSPVIEDLKAQAAMPISHQSTGRFLAAASMLIQLLRDLEAE